MKLTSQKNGHKTTSKGLAAAAYTRGFTLIEMIVYISILSVFTFVIVNTLISFSSTYREVRIDRAMDNTAVTSLERMTRDIRKATSVTLGQSTLGTHPGVLTLFTIDTVNSTTTRFYVDNGVLKIDVNGVYSGPLSLVQTPITNLVFARLISTTSEAVKIDMTVEYPFGSTTKTKNYHTTVILKGL